MTKTEKVIYEFNELVKWLRDRNADENNEYSDSWLVAEAYSLGEIDLDEKSRGYTINKEIK
tara:strand:- start:2342 stop:2524 length:183 start_codon:yes stop_codon:yes gene_type:complete